METLTHLLREWAQPGLARAAAEAAALMRLPDGARLLVIGADLAAGEDSPAHRLDVTRLDLNPGASPLDALPFQSERFQGVVYPVLPAPPSAASSFPEAARVLAPGGWMAVGMGVNPETPPNSDAATLAQVVGLMDRLAEGAVRAAMARAGLQVAAQHPAVLALRETLHAVANKLQVVSMMRDLHMGVTIPGATIDHLLEALAALRAGARAGSLDFRLVIAQKGAARAQSGV